MKLDGLMTKPTNIHPASKPTGVAIQHAACACVRRPATASAAAWLLSKIISDSPACIDLHCRLLQVSVRTIPSNIYHADTGHHKFCRRDRAEADKEMTDDCGMGMRCTMWKSACRPTEESTSSTQQCLAVTCCNLFFDLSGLRQIRDHTASDLAQADESQGCAVHIAPLLGTSVGAL